MSMTEPTQDFSDLAELLGGVDVEQLKAELASPIVNALVDSQADMAVRFYKRVRDKANLTNDQATTLTAAFVRSGMGTQS